MNDLNKNTQTKEVDETGPGNKNVILYTIHCPKCTILEKKLASKNIKFTISEDIEIMMNKGFKSAPMLEVDGEIYDFGQAVKWINAIGG